jgi:DNA-binding beta-propeller fold protein YncE
MPYDNGGVRFTQGGTIAYKSAGTSKKIYKINAATKTVMDSVTTVYQPGAVVVSSDSSQLFVCNATNTKVMVHSTATMALVDSMDCQGRMAMNIYHHPSRPEIWAVHHFNDSVSVFNESTHALVAAFGISGSPWYLAFSTGTTEVGAVSQPADQIAVFPNPASNAVVVSMPDNEPRQLIISDVAGRVVKQQEVNAVYQSINVADLAPGCYLFTITENGRVLKTIKWVKQ